MLVDYSVREMRERDVRHGFLETLQNLTTVDLDEDEAGEVFRTMNDRPEYRIFVAEEEDTREVVGSTTLVVEQKFIHGGSKAGHIEDVVTREGYEGYGIGSAVVTAAVKKAEELGCYRVQLECGEDLVPFYENLGFQKHELNMRYEF